MASALLASPSSWLWPLGSNVQVFIGLEGLSVIIWKKISVCTPLVQQLPCCSGPGDGTVDVHNHGSCPLGGGDSLLIIITNGALTVCQAWCKWYFQESLQWFLRRDSLYSFCRWSPWTYSRSSNFSSATKLRGGDPSLSGSNIQALFAHDLGMRWELCSYLLQEHLGCWRNQLDFSGNCVVGFL